MEQQCGKCTACVDICPQQAFTGRVFCEDEPQEARFDAAACACISVLTEGNPEKGTVNKGKHGFSDY